MNYFNFINNIRKTITVNPNSFFTVSDFRDNAKIISLIVRFFYIVLCFFFYGRINHMMKMGFVEPSSMLWPMKLFWGLLLEGNSIAFVSGALITSLFTIVFPGSFLLRSLTFFSLLLFVAYDNSFGSLNHGFHFLVYISFLFLLLPNINYSKLKFSKRESLHFINIFWLIQFTLLSLYTLSGAWKVIGFKSELFSTNTLLFTVIERSIQNDGKYIMWQGIAASYPLLLQVFHIAVVLVQLLSIFLFFRPHLIKFYGVLLISFHFGTVLLMGIAFNQHIFVWGLFFVITPLAPKNISLISILYSFHGLAFFLQRVFPLPDSLAQLNNSSAIIIYDKECPFCSNYTALMKLRLNIGSVELIDARSKHSLVYQAKKKGFDLNEGMILIYNNTFYYGSDAIHMITFLSNTNGFFASINHFLFSNKNIATFTYPVYKFGRRATLALLGKELIRN